MIKSFKYALAVLLLTGFSWGAIASTGTSVSALTENQIAACEAIGDADCGTGANDENGTSKIDSTIKTVVNTLSVIIGVVAVIMIIVAGFKYITSGGDSNKVGSAKNTLMYALIGVAIVALAQAIVWFVLGTLSKGQA